MTVIIDFGQNWFLRLFLDGLSISFASARVMQSLVGHMKATSALCSSAIIQPTALSPNYEPIQDS